MSTNMNMIIHVDHSQVVIGRGGVGKGSEGEEGDKSIESAEGSMLIPAGQSITIKTYYTTSTLLTRIFGSHSLVTAAGPSNPLEYAHTEIYSTPVVLVRNV